MRYKAGDKVARTVFREKAKNLNYDYVNKFTRESAKEILLKFPVDEENNIDFNYMENFMKNISQKVKNTFSNLRNLDGNNKKINKRKSIFRGIY